MSNYFNPELTNSVNMAGVDNIAPIQNDLETSKIKSFDDPDEEMKVLGELLDKVENQKALVQQVVNTFTQGIENRQNKQDIWEKVWLAYIMEKSSKLKQREKDNPWEENQILPWVFEAIETASITLTDALLPNKEDFFDIEPQITNDPVQELNAKIMNKLLKTILQKNGFLEEFPKFIKQLVLCGNSVARVRNEESIFTDKIKYRDELGQVKVEKVKQTINTPIFEHFDIQDFSIWPLNQSIKKCDCVQRVVMNICDVKNNKWDAENNRFGYINTDKVEPNAALTASTSTSATLDTRKENIDTQMGLNSVGSAFQDTDQVEILEFWGTVRLENDRFQNVIVIVANREVLLAIYKNPFDDKKPFIFTGYTPIPNQIYSIGLGEQMLSTWQSATTLHNLMLENTKLKVNSIYSMVQDDDPLVDIDNIEFYPGAVIAVKEKGALSAVNQGGDLASGFNYLQFLKQQSDSTSAVSDVVRGAFPTPVQTATAVNMAGNNATKHFAETANHINSTSLVPTLELIYELAREYMSFEEIAEITGTDIDQLNNLFRIPLKGYNVKITGVTTSVQRLTALQNIGTLTMQILQTPAAQYIDWAEWLKYVLKLQEIDDPLSLMLPEKTVEQMQDMEMVQRLAPPVDPNEAMLDQQMPDESQGMM